MSKVHREGQRTIRLQLETQILLAHVFDKENREKPEEGQQTKERRSSHNSQCKFSGKWNTFTKSGAVTRKWTFMARESSLRSRLFTLDIYWTCWVTARLNDGKLFHASAQKTPTLKLRGRLISTLRTDLYIGHAQPIFLRFFSNQCCW